MYNNIKDFKVNFICSKLEKDIFQFKSDTDLTYIYKFNLGDVLVINDESFFVIQNNINNIVFNLKLSSGKELLDNSIVKLSDIKIYPYNNMDYSIFVPKQYLNSKFIKSELELMHKSNGLLSYNLSNFKEKQINENILYSNGRDLTNNEILLCELLELNKDEVQDRKKLLYHYYKYKVKDIEHLILYIKSLFNITLPINIIRYYIDDDGNISESKDSDNFYRSNLIKLEINSKLNNNKNTFFNVLMENINNVSLLSLSSKEIVTIKFNIYNVCGLFYQGFYFANLK